MSEEKCPFQTVLQGRSLTRRVFNADPKTPPKATETKAKAMAALNDYLAENPIEPPTEDKE